jgi:protease-4
METDPQWERKVITDLAQAALKEQRATRRWGIFFKLLLFIYLFLAFALWVAVMDGDLAVSSDKHTAVIELKGVISDDSAASADKIVSALRKAFEHKGTQGVILRINSPGGSPVQSAYIHDEILRLRKKYPKIPVYAVIADICASGGYYVAVAADKIYADKSSLVGSVGVLMNGFGFVEAMEKIGVERRLLTAGEHKGVLDPFSPIDETEKLHVQGILDHLHQNFIKVVKEGRGERLKGDDKQLFSGLFWSGIEGKKLGLVDDFGSASSVARDVIGVKEMVNFTPKDDLLERFANSVGVGAVKSLAGLAGMTLR